MMMMYYYYVLWSDAINWSRSSIKTIGIWKMQTLGFITFAMSFNIGVISLLIDKIISYNLSIFNLTVEFSSSEKINGFLGAFLVFYFPPLVINYFLIFYKNKWVLIRKKYPHKNGRIYKYYILLSLSPLIILFILAIFYKLFKILLLSVYVNNFSL